MHSRRFRPPAAPALRGSLLGKRPAQSCCCCRCASRRRRQRRRGCRSGRWACKARQARKQAGKQAGPGQQQLRQHRRQCCMPGRCTRKQDTRRPSMCCVLCSVCCDLPLPLPVPPIRPRPPVQRQRRLLREGGGDAIAPQCQQHQQHRHRHLRGSKPLEARHNIPTFYVFKCLQPFPSARHGRARVQVRPRQAARLARGLSPAPAPPICPSRHTARAWPAAPAAAAATAPSPAPHQQRRQRGVREHDSMWEHDSNVQ